MICLELSLWMGFSLLDFPLFVILDIIFKVTNLRNCCYKSSIAKRVGSQGFLKPRLHQMVSDHFCQPSKSAPSIVVRSTLQLWIAKEKVEVARLPQQSNGKICNVIWITLAPGLGWWRQLQAITKQLTKLGAKKQHLQILESWFTRKWCESLPSAKFTRWLL